MITTDTVKILLLVIKNQMANLESFYQGIAEHALVDLRHLDSKQQSHLQRYFKTQVDVNDYDRIVCLLRFKREIRQVGFLRTVPNLVILEHDACQNYFAESKYYGKFSRHYRDLPWARVLVSGYQISRKLQREGHDVYFVPKPYDNKLLKNLKQDRTIELGFVGTIKSGIYNRRNELLAELTRQLGVEILTTKPGQDYLDTLNNIRCFVGADIGFGEYMTKNFEAMACGCLLLTWNQGEEENQALKFRDMENVVLYSSIDELKEKLVLLKNDPALVQSIANAGQQLAESRHNCSIVGEMVVNAITPPLRDKHALSPFDKYKYLFRR